MSTATARIEREIASEEAALRVNLAALEDKARALTDWRRQVGNRPMASVGIAFAGGVLLAALAGTRRNAPRADGDTEEAPSVLTHPLVDRFVAAFAAVAAERAIDALGGLMSHAPAHETVDRPATDKKAP
jgi:hypothetical protein